MVEQDAPTESVAATDFNIDGILKKILKIFNTPTAPVSSIHYNHFFCLKKMFVTSIGNFLSLEKDICMIIPFKFLFKMIVI